MKNRSIKFARAMLIIDSLRPDLVAVAKYWDAEIIYLWLAKQGYTWHSFDQQWRKSADAASAPTEHRNNAVETSKDEVQP